jgi:hypothetical protein
MILRCGIYVRSNGMLCFVAKQGIPSFHLRQETCTEVCHIKTACGFHTRWIISNILECFARFVFSNITSDVECRKLLATGYWAKAVIKMDSTPFHHIYCILLSVECSTIHHAPHPSLRSPIVHDLLKPNWALSSSSTSTVQSA